MFRIKVESCVKCGGEKALSAGLTAPRRPGYYLSSILGPALCARRRADARDLWVVGESKKKEAIRRPHLNAHILNASTTPCARCNTSFSLRFSKCVRAHAQMRCRASPPRFLYFRAPPRPSRFLFTRNSHTSRPPPPASYRSLYILASSAPRRPQQVLLTSQIPRPRTHLLGAAARRLA